MNYSTTGNNTEVISPLNLFPQKFKLSVQCNLSPLTVSIPDYGSSWLKHMHAYALGTYFSNLSGESSRRGNRSFPSTLVPLFQSESKCEAMTLPA